MKPYSYQNRTLPVRRRPVSKGVWKRLSAVTNTRRKKQRVSAAPAVDDLEDEDQSSKISRALTIIFLFHILALGLFFYHQHYLDGRMPVVEKNEPEPVAPALTAKPPARAQPVQLSTGERIYQVRVGDNYERIAAAHQVDVNLLRELNANEVIRPGLVLQLPPEGSMTASAHEQTVAEPPRARDEGLVQAVPVGSGQSSAAAGSTSSSVPRAIVVDAATVSFGASHRVRPGDTIWSISQKHGVDPDALMRHNQITDARRLRVDMELKIP